MKEDLTNPEWVSYARECIGRLEAIRDAFLTGRDAEAVQMICELDEKGGRKVLGINSVEAIQPGAVVFVRVAPQLPFKADRFCVDESCARFFRIVDIRRGTHSQFLAPTDLAGSIASSRIRLDDLLDRILEDHTIKIDRTVEELIGVAIDMPVCEVGQELNVTVINVSDELPMEFHGAFFGRQVIR